MITGLREGSLYYKAYYALRQPFLDMLFDGIAWDKESAENEKHSLSEKREAIKKELDTLAGTTLYPVDRKRSRLLLRYYDQQRSFQVARRNAGARTERGRELGAELRALQSRIKEIRSSDAAWEYEFGESLSNVKLGAYLYGKEEGQLALPEAKRRRKETGKLTVTVDDVALQKIAQRFGSRTLPSGNATLRDLLGKVREHRRCEKLISTYLNPDKLLSPTDGRFHAMYKPFGTQTGRPSSSSDPWNYGGNAQNIDRDYKWLFVPDLEVGCRGADSSGLEKNQPIVDTISEIVQSGTTERMGRVLARPRSDDSESESDLFLLRWRDDGGAA